MVFVLVWTALKWILASASLVIVFMSNVHFFKSSKGSTLHSLCKAGFISLFLVSIMSPVSFNFWHLYLIYPIALIPVAFYLARLKQWRIIGFALSGYFVLYSFISGWESYKHKHSSKQGESYAKLMDRGEDLKRQFDRYTIKL